MGTAQFTPLTRANDSDVILGWPGKVPAVVRGGLDERDAEQGPGLHDPPPCEDFPWRMQDIGLMGLRLDDQREYRLHVWDPSYNVGEPPVHDHPYDFKSKIIVGEMTNTRYVEDPAGDEYVRFRYSPAPRTSGGRDTVRLSAAPETFDEGGRVPPARPRTPRELATARHGDGDSLPWVEPRELTVCLRDEATGAPGKGGTPRTRRSRRSPPKLWSGSKGFAGRAGVNDSLYPAHVPRRSRAAWPADKTWIRIRGLDQLAP